MSVKLRVPIIGWIVSGLVTTLLLLFVVWWHVRPTRTVFDDPQYFGNNAPKPLQRFKNAAGRAERQAQNFWLTKLTQNGEEYAQAAQAANVLNKTAILAATLTLDELHTGTEKIEEIKSLSAELNKIDPWPEKNRVLWKEKADTFLADAKRLHDYLVTEKAIDTNNGEKYPDGTCINLRGQWHNITGTIRNLVQFETNKEPGICDEYSKRLLNSLQAIFDAPGTNIETMSDPKLTQLIDCAKDTALPPAVRDAAVARYKEWFPWPKKEIIHDNEPYMVIDFNKGSSEIKSLLEDQDAGEYPGELKIFLDNRKDWMLKAATQIAEWEKNPDTFDFSLFKDEGPDEIRTFADRWDAARTAFRDGGEAHTDRHLQTRIHRYTKLVELAPTEPMLETCRDRLKHYEELKSWFSETPCEYRDKKAEEQWHKLAMHYKDAERMPTEHRVFYHRLRRAYFCPPSEDSPSRSSIRDDWGKRLVNEADSLKRVEQLRVEDEVKWAKEVQELLWTREKLLGYTNLDNILGHNVKGEFERVSGSNQVKGFLAEVEKFQKDCLDFVQLEEQAMDMEGLAKVINRGEAILEKASPLCWKEAIKKRLNPFKDLQGALNKESPQDTWNRIAAVRKKHSEAPRTWQLLALKLRRPYVPFNSESYANGEGEMLRREALDFRFPDEKNFVDAMESAMKIRQDASIRSSMDLLHDKFVPGIDPSGKELLREHAKATSFLDSLEAIRRDLSTLSEQEGKISAKALNFKEHKLMDLKADGENIAALLTNALTKSHGQPWEAQISDRLQLWNECLAVMQAGTPDEFLQILRTKSGNSEFSTALRQVSMAAMCCQLALEIPREKIDTFSTQCKKYANELETFEKDDEEYADFCRSLSQAASSVSTLLQLEKAALLEEYSAPGPDQKSFSVLTSDDWAEWFANLDARDEDKLNEFKRLLQDDKLAEYCRFIGQAEEATWITSYLKHIENVLAIKESTHLMPPDGDSQNAVASGWISFERLKDWHCELRKQEWLEQHREFIEIVDGQLEELLEAEKLDGECKYDKAEKKYAEVRSVSKQILVYREQRRARSRALLEEHTYQLNAIRIKKKDGEYYDAKIYINSDDPKKSIDGKVERNGEFVVITLVNPYDLIWNWKKQLTIKVTAERKRTWWQPDKRETLFKYQRFIPVQRGLKVFVDYLDPDPKSLGFKYAWPEREVTTINPVSIKYKSFDDMLNALKDDLGKVLEGNQDLNGLLQMK